MTVKSLLELLDTLLGVDEYDPANDDNEFTISDGAGGTIELGVNRGKEENTIVIRRKGLKLTLSTDEKPKRVIKFVLKNNR